MQNNMIAYFEETVEKYSKKTAIVDRGRRISFEELRAGGRGLAKLLLEACGYKNNRPIAVFLPKSADVVIADIAVTYSCNIFMNLDVNQPLARLQNILDHIHPACIVTDRDGRDMLGEVATGFPVVIMDGREPEGQPEGDALDRRLLEMIDTDPFCIINTSGSTGTPKGVVLNHRGFFDFLDQTTKLFHLDGGEIVGSLSPAVFDIFVFELCLMMMRGATIVLLDGGLAAFPAKLMQYMAEAEVNFIFWVPSIMVNIANMDLLSRIPLTGLKQVWFAGEVFPTKQFNYWKKHLPKTVLANLYGPIEISLDCTYYIPDREFADDEPLPIGFPFRNTDVLLLNENDELCLGMEAGEICVRGTSLAMGYYNNPEKTAQVFVQNPLQVSYPELIYRTGDIAYRNERGELMFKGRKDSLIKHMGYRIELGEIEHVLINTLKLVKYGCVVYHFARKEITLFYEADEEIPAAAFRGQLLTVVPKYMIPAVYRRMDQLPRNVNGKIDRHYLDELVNGAL